MQQVVKQAVSQQKDNNLNVQTVQIGKHLASFLVPDYNEGQKLSVIDDGVLKHLKNLLPKASADEIIQQLIDELKDIRNYSALSEMLPKAVSAAKDFIAFQTSINIIKQYFDPTVTVVRELPFNVEPPKPKEISEMDLDELHAVADELIEQKKQMDAKENEIRIAMEKFRPNIKTEPTVVA